MTSEYTPGNAVGVIAPDVAVLVGLDAQDALVTELFACVSGSPTLEDIVEVLLSRGLRQLHGSRQRLSIPTESGSSCEGTSPLRWKERTPFVDQACWWTDSSRMRGLCD